MKPLCPVFYMCDGCQYQDIPYEEELKLKEQQLKQLFAKFALPDNVFIPILKSPQEYHYRHRIDLKLSRGHQNKIRIGFQPRFGPVLEIDQCPIVKQSISNSLPKLKKEITEFCPDNYRIANLTIRSGDDNHVKWGGIGKGSLELKEEDYLYTEIEGRKIFFSLDTFFQANLSVLPDVMKLIKALPIWEDEPIFYDLYGGVGLFGLGLLDKVSKVRFIESSTNSITLARYNVRYHQLTNFAVYAGRVEDQLPDLIKQDEGAKVMMVDPPRSGLSPSMIDLLMNTEGVEDLLYLSCGPEALVGNLKVLQDKWSIQKIMPLDFFPRTKHVETLVWLKSHAFS